MKLNIKFTALAAVFIAALMLLTPISQINTSGGGGIGNSDLDFLNSLDINNNHFVLSADQNSYSDKVSISEITSSSEGKLSTKDGVISDTTAITVSSTNELKILSDIVNGTYDPNQSQQPIKSDFSGYTVILTDDLTFDVSDQEQLNFTPIGKDESHKFNGTFDGQGHTISNLSVNITSDSGDVYAGLFGVLGEESTVKNLGIINSLISATSTNDYASSGGLAGSNYGTIINCYNTGAVTATSESGDAYSGGIAGFNTMLDYVGGTIINCYNTGTVKADSTNYNANSGGIAGENYGTIITCYNTGNMTAISIDNNAFSGGIAGNNNGTIKDCYNTGNMTTAADNFADSGGIAGNNYRTIINCYNTGNMTTTAYGNATSGGIVGDNNYGTIINCYNTGNMTAISISTSTYDAAYSGGIAGSNEGTITNCYNTGDVALNPPNNNAYSGGIAGNNSGTITNCYNTGAVTATSTNRNATSGGIVGDNNTGTITNCYNTGVVESNTGSKSYSGGIAGSNKEQGVIYGEITNCYNIGTVTATSTNNNAYSGGIAGFNNNSTIKYCYSKVLINQNLIGEGTIPDTCKTFGETGILSDNGGSLLDALNKWVEDANKQDSDKYRYWMNPFIQDEKYPVFTDWYGEAKRLSTPPLEVNSKGVYEIKNGYQLALIADGLDGNYVLSDDIDLSGHEWRPIGDKSIQFNGTFDGQGHTISNLSVNITSDSGDVYAGLFGVLGEESTVKNLGIINSLISATSTNDYASSGGLAGSNYGTIINCYNKGIVAVSSESGDAYSGGIVGINSGTITNCYNTGAVTATSESDNALSGGIAGQNSGTITNCYNTGAVTATSESDNALSGGIAGQNSGTITNCYWLNNISNGVGSGIQITYDNEINNGKIDEEGKVGSTFLHTLLNDWVVNNNHGDMAYYLPWTDDSYPELKTHPTEHNEIYEIRTASDLSFVTDDLDGSYILLNDIDLSEYEKWDPIGGSAEFNGTFDGNGHVISNMTITGDMEYAGLFGYIGNSGVVKNLGLVKSSINISSSDNAYSGGIAGENDGTIENCYNTGTVVATADNAYSGGIVGINFGIITNCYNTGTVTAISTSTSEYYYASSGGIAGENYGTIENCYNTGNMAATDGYTSSGGIAGYNDGSIENCYNTGTVTANATFTDNYASSGGIVGDNWGLIENCYNIGAVKATSTNSTAYLGGIAGSNNMDEENNIIGKITNCYNTGTVTATSTNNNASSGGIAGSNDGTITNCYYFGTDDSIDGTTNLSEDAMTGLNLLGVGSSNNLNKEQDSKPWSPDIFNVNEGYPILADVPTQLDPKNSTNKIPQSAVYILSKTEDTQAENYLELIITSGLRVETIKTVWEGLTTPQYNWYIYGSDKSQGSDATIDIAETDKLIVYYVTVSYTIENTEYKYTSLTRSAYKFDNMILFHSNGGSYVEPIVKNPGESISAPEYPVKEGYTFTGWYKDEDLKEQYAFTTMPSGVTILYAGWEKNSITPPPTPPPYDPTPGPTPDPDPEPKPIVPDENNNITVPPIDEEKTEELINETISSGSDSISIIDANNVEGEYIEVTVSKSDLETISKKIENNNNINSVSIETSEGDIIIEKEVLSSILETTDADSISFEIEDAKDKLTDEQKEAVGDRPVYDINIKAGNENITSFNGKTITISLPYTLKPGEDPENIVVYYVKEDGSLEKMNCTYKDGKVIFETDHLSKYVIGYEESEPVTPDTPDNKKDDNNTIYYAVAAIVVVLIIIALAYYFMKKKQ